MDEFAKVIKELKKNTFAAELANGKIFGTNGCAVEVLMSKMKEDEEFFMDSLVGVKILDKAGALLMVHANVCGVYAKNITEDAEEILEYFAIETEYENKIADIPEEKCQVKNKKISYKDVVKDVEDPMEAFEKLNELF